MLRQWWVKPCNWNQPVNLHTNTQLPFSYSVHLAYTIYYVMVIPLARQNDSTYSSSDIMLPVHINIYIPVKLPHVQEYLVSM